MNILHTIPTIDQEANGPSYSVVRLCESQISCGLNVTLAHLRRGDVPEKSFSKGYDYGFGPKKLGRSRELRRGLEMAVRAGQIDVLHNHSLWMMPNVYPGWVSKTYNIPLVTAPRGTLSTHAFATGSWFKRPFWSLVQRPSLEQTTCFHATSESECNDIRRFGFRKPVAIIPNGIDLPLNVSSPTGTRKRLLYLGRIHPIKGLELLLRAWKRLELSFPDWDLDVVGPDNRNHLGYLKDLSGRLELNRLNFRRPVYGEQKHRLLSSSDLFVLPTYSENFGVAVAESLAAGTPVVVTKGAPWKGVIENDAGWWCDVDEDSITEALCDAMGNSRCRLSRMGENGRNWMARDFAWSAQAMKLRLTYEWIVNGGDTPEWVRLVD